MKKKPKMKHVGVEIYSARLGRTAIHEAGHVLMAAENGNPFEEVVLAKTKEMHGIVRNVAHRRGDDEVVRVALGGIVAVRLCRSRWYPALFNNAFDDLGTVADFYRGMQQAAWGIDYNVKSTVTEVSTRWATVEALARQLLIHRKLTSDLALEIVQESRPRRQPPTRMVESEWQPLIDQIHRRIRYPGGLPDLLRELGAGRAP